MDDEGEREMRNNPEPGADSFEKLLASQKTIVARQAERIRQCENRLREADENYHAFLATTTDCAFITTLDGEWVDFNDAAVGFFGYGSREELMGARIHDLYADPAERERHIREIQEKGFSLKYAVNLKRKDGSIVNALITSVPRKDAAGNITGFQGIIRDITARIANEEALRENRFLLEEALDMGRMAFWEYDVPTGIFTFNDRFYALYGTTADREGGYRMSAETYARNFIPPDEAGVVAQEIEKTIRTGDPAYYAELQHSIIRRDGEIRYILVRYRITKDATGRTVKTHGVNQDITARRMGENALRESNLLLEGALDLGHMAYWVYDALADQLTVTDQFFRLYKTTAEREGGYRMPIKSLISRYIHPDDAGRIAREIENTVRTGTPSDFTELEHRIIRRDGEIRHLMVRYRMTVANGRLVKTHGIIQDITERKKAEEELRESEAHLASVLMGTPVLQFVIDKNHRIISWNKAIEMASGRKTADMTGTTDQWKAFYPDKRPVLADLLLDEAIDTIPEWYEGKIRKSPLVDEAYEATDFFPAMGDSGKWLYFTAAPIRDAGGAIIGAVETLLDITERKKADLALQESNERFLFFIKEAAMRLKNPLEVVEGNIAGVIHDIDQGSFECRDLSLQLRIQTKNLEQIRRNIIELNKMIVDRSGDISEASKRFLTE